MKNFVTGSTRLVKVSVCSSFNTFGYGKTCEVCNWPRNRFIVKDCDCLTSFFESDDFSAECEAVVENNLFKHNYELIKTNIKIGTDKKIISIFT